MSSGEMVGRGLSLRMRRMRVRREYPSKFAPQGLLSHERGGLKGSN